MYKLANGWTKETVMEQVKKYNKNRRCVASSEGGRAGICVYQADDGNRCAIGCFIPDNHVGLSSAGGVMTLLFRYPDLINYMPFKNNEALSEFQNAHDTCTDKASVYVSIQDFLTKKVE